MIAILRTSLACGLLACSAAGAADQRNEQGACTPGMSFWSLLGSVNVGYADGHLQMDKLYAVCLPQPKTPTDSNYAYSPEQGGKLTTLLKSADGQTLTTYVWHAESISGLWELTDYKVLGGYEATKQLGAGKYTLEFQADGSTFTRFSFSVATAPRENPYHAPGRRWFVERPWSEYGNVFWQRNDPQSTLRFTTWVQDKVGHLQPQKSMPYEAQLVRASEGKVIGEDKGTLHA